MANETPEFFNLRPEVEKQYGYRSEICKTQFPTGSWLGVKELAFPEFMIEIELDAYKSELNLHARLV